MMIREEFKRDEVDGVEMMEIENGEGAFRVLSV